MARTPSTMPPLGGLAPDFELPDTEGNLVRISDSHAAKGYLVIFLCNHCPYVIHIRERLAEVTKGFAAKGITVFGINSNDAENYPEDSPEKMRTEKVKQGYPFPYLFDESQQVAKAYQAACTPDFFLYDEKRKLVYRGQFDDSRPESNVPVTGADLTQAVTNLLARKPQSASQRPSLGCNIKWK